MKSVGIITDAHIPFENKRHYACMMNAFAGTGLDALYIIGDYLDFYWANQHGPKHPLVLKGFTDEIEAGNKRLDEIDKTFPGIPKYFIEGNHEWRFERYLVAKCPELFGLTSVPHLLHLETRPGWTWVPYGPRQKMRVENSNLWIRHDPGPGRGEALVRNLGDSLVHGHTHRISTSTHVTLSGRTNVVICGGWLGDIRFDKIFGYVQGHHLWNAGFVHVVVHDKSFDFGIVPISTDSTCVLNGKKYRP